MAKTAKRNTGDLGEEIACKYLENKGYVVIERNYLRPWGEIDIIAKKNDRLYFVEVKTVTREPRHGRGEPGRTNYVRPEENMHANKVKRLHRAIQTYLLQKKIAEEVAWQLDLACVYLEPSEMKARVELLENIIL